MKYLLNVIVDDSIHVQIAFEFQYASIYVAIPEVILFIKSAYGIKDLR